MINVHDLIGALRVYLTDDFSVLIIPDKKQNPKLRAFLLVYKEACHPIHMFTEEVEDDDEAICLALDYAPEYMGLIVEDILMDSFIPECSGKVEDCNTMCEKSQDNVVEFPIPQ